MELDDLKNTWEDISGRVNKQQHLSPEIIEKITRAKYYPGFKKIAYPEITGVIICIAAAVFVILTFSRLDTHFLQGVGIVFIVLLLALSAISVLSLRQFSRKGDVNKTYAETLKDFAVQKIRFHKLQRINATLSYVLLVTTIVLLSKLFGNNDITNSKYFWIYSFSFGYIFLLCFTGWVNKYYKKTLQQTEALLIELVS